tara:strand:- start:145 stop:453 length:309 start_codon:yes stop_codon:yes gene_type:complete
MTASTTTATIKSGSPQSCAIHERRELGEIHLRTPSYFNSLSTVSLPNSAIRNEEIRIPNTIQTSLFFSNFTLSAILVIGQDCNQEAIEPYAELAACPAVEPA